MHRLARERERDCQTSSWSKRSNREDIRWTLKKLFSCILNIFVGNTFSHRWQRTSQLGTSSRRHDRIEEFFQRTAETDDLRQMFVSIDSLLVSVEPTMRIAIECYSLYQWSDSWCIASDILGYWQSDSVLDWIPPELFDWLYLHSKQEDREMRHWDD